MSRTHGVILFVALLAIAATVLWQRPAADPALARGPGDIASALPRGAVPAEAATGTPAVDARGERSAAATPAAPTEVPDANAPPITVTGTITAVDARGIEHTTCDGTVELQFLYANADKPTSFASEDVVAAVAAGRWQADAPAHATKLQVGKVELDGRPALCADERDLDPAGPPVSLRARWLEPFLLLRVLADDTGADLGDLRVVQMGDPTLEDCPHPGNKNRIPVLEHASSPLRLANQSTRAKERYWATAPGYAWNQVALSTIEPGERVLRLRPGGDVDVVIVGDAPADARLRVRQTGFTDGLPFAELRPVAGGTTRVDALPAGTWSIALEKGDWYRERVVFGRVDAAVTTGTVTSATISLEQAPERPAAFQIGGTLRVSPRWGRDLSVEVEPTGPTKVWDEYGVKEALANMRQLDEGLYRWGPFDVVAGRYELTVHGCQHHAIVPVGPAHPTEITIVVPDPNEVRVRLLDGMDGKPMAGANPGWCGLLEGWQSGWRPSPMQELGDGWYTFQAPAGQLQISVHPDGYVWLLSTHEVRPGRNEFVLRVPRAFGIEITLKDGDTAVPWPDDAEVEIEHVVSKSGAAYWSGNKVAAEEPGEHTLTLNELDGFLPVPPQRVVIEPAKWTKVEIRLQRKP